ncbi:MAG: Rieske (2Fe-2S) protein [Methanomassiliicoccus sp.]|nr:Rieske (2Fe-2S) protein [Methanomassiliicoccus sp.]
MVKIKACLASELPPGKMSNITLLGRIVLLANVEGQLFAMDGLCSSDGGNLAEGALNGYTVRCPIHGSEFDLRSGNVVEQSWDDGKRSDDLRTYPISQDGDCIMVDI